MYLIDTIHSSVRPRGLHLCNQIKTENPQTTDYDEWSYRRWNVRITVVGIDWCDLVEQRQTFEYGIDEQTPSEAMGSTLVESSGEKESAVDEVAFLWITHVLQNLIDFVEKDLRQKLWKILSMWTDAKWLRDQSDIAFDVRLVDLCRRLVRHGNDETRMVVLEFSIEIAIDRESNWTRVVYRWDQTFPVEQHAFLHTRWTQGSLRHFSLFLFARPGWLVSLDGRWNLDREERVSLLDKTRNTSVLYVSSILTVPISERSMSSLRRTGSSRQISRQFKRAECSPFVLMYWVTAVPSEPVGWATIMNELSMNILVDRIMSHLCHSLLYMFN